MLKRNSVIVVRFIEMPEDVQDELRAWHLFNKDCLLTLGTSYRLGDGEQTPEHMLKEVNFRELYDYVKVDDGFNGSFEDFLRLYRFRALYWVACQNPDLRGIDSILVDTSW